MNMKYIFYLQICLTTPLTNRQVNFIHVSVHCTPSGTRMRLPPENRTHVNLAHNIRLFNLGYYIVCSLDWLNVMFEHKPRLLNSATTQPLLQFTKQEFCSTRNKQTGFIAVYTFWLLFNRPMFTSRYLSRSTTMIVSDLHKI